MPLSLSSFFLALLSPHHPLSLSLVVSQTGRNIRWGDFGAGSGTGMGLPVSWAACGLGVCCYCLVLSPDRELSMESADLSVAYVILQPYLSVSKVGGSHL